MPLAISMKSSSVRARFLPLASLLFALGIVFSSPYIGRLRDYLVSYFGDYFELFLYILLGTFLIDVALFLSVHIKTERLKRYGGAAAVALCLVLLRRGLISQDARVAMIELIHFAEYGILSLLIFYALQGKLSNWLAYGWSLILTTTVGISDEGLQWFISSRVGDLRDVAINSSAAVIGQLFLLLVIYPQGISFKAPSRYLGSFFLGLALFILVGGLFIDGVQRGYWIEDTAIGQFKSSFPPSKLRQLPEERFRRWSQNPLLLRELSGNKSEPLWQREDFYLTEARCHTRWRNSYAVKRDLYRALKENLILMKYYHPYLSLTHQGWEKKRIQRYLKKAGNQMEQPYCSICFWYLYHLPRRPIYWPVVFCLASVPFSLALWQKRRGRWDKGLMENGNH